MTSADDPKLAIATDDVTRIVNALLAPYLSRAMSELDGAAALLAGMGRYHLGLVDRAFHPLPTGSSGTGKRMRPAIALLCCSAAGGQMAPAAPVAAAIELLHNFTLIHDDIQDGSATRRHRPTVWSIWGVPQAINAGDALYAAAHGLLYASLGTGVAAELVLEIAAAFDRMTIEIVAGQVRDLDFEGRREVSPAEYFQMIDGKTAAIVRFAAWAGARIAGADGCTAERFGEFGRALGLGFQIQDDLLGVWGLNTQTGKAAGDDIRRKKQSLPILMLRGQLTGSAALDLEALYRQPELDRSAVDQVLAMLECYRVRPAVEAHVSAYHDVAREALADAVGPATSSARTALFALVASLATRTA